MVYLYLLSGVCATRTEQIVVVDCHCPLGRADPGMDSIATELALFAIDRLTQWAFSLISVAILIIILT